MKNKAVTISKKQWENIGKSAGWIKTAQVDINSLFDESEGTNPTAVYVSVYKVSRASVGPENNEENNWYHHYVNELKASKKFFDREEADEFFKKVQEWIDNNDGNYFAAIETVQGEQDNTDKRHIAKN